MTESSVHPLMAGKSRQEERKFLWTKSSPEPYRILYQKYRIILLKAGGKGYCRKKKISTIWTSFTGFREMRYINFGQGKTACMQEFFKVHLFLFIIPIYEERLADSSQLNILFNSKLWLDVWSLANYICMSTWLQRLSIYRIYTN